MNGPIARDPWDDVEQQILSAVQQPHTLPGIAALTGLPPDTVKSQISAMVARGLVIDNVRGGVRYQITLTGRRRLHALTPIAEHGKAA